MSDTREADNITLEQAQLIINKRYAEAYEIKRKWFNEVYEKYKTEDSRLATAIANLEKDIQTKTKDLNKLTRYKSRLRTTLISQCPHYAMENRYCSTCGFDHRD